MHTPWIRGLLIASMVTALAGCDDEPSESIELTVETFNVGLAGAFIPHEEARRRQLAEAIAASPADVVCLQEVWFESDKELIATGVSSTFPHAAWTVSDYDTQVDDPEDQDGSIPPTPTSPPCGPAELQTILDDALSCLMESCSTVPGSDEGRTTSTTCAQEACISQVASMILTDDPQTLRCYACMATGLPTSTFGEIRESCTTETNGELTFGGQNGVMILSRYPVRDTSEWVLPGTWNRRVVAQATVELPNGADVDIYCNHLTPIFDDIAFPYTGVYGQGELGAAGWTAELLLQSGKLIDLVAADSGDQPAIILGDFNTGREYVGEGVILHDEGPVAIDLLESAFTPAVTEDYTPTCTHCPENANTSESTPPVWIDHIFLSGIDVSAVTATERVYDENVIEVEGGDLVPLSDHYGLRSVVTIEP